MQFSALDRDKTLDAITERPYDLVVIGGGITGAGILLDAVTRGMRVLLVEKEDFAWGTSSRSTKLIHGGLRYLKQLEFGLVREMGRERAVVHRNARHLVRPEPLLLPLIEGGSLGKWSSSVALWVYDFLADVEAGEKRVMLDQSETLQKEPLLNAEIVEGGAHYYEYRTDDGRLTISVIKTAVERGGHAVHYLEAADFVEKDGRISGVVLRDRVNGRELTVGARAVVNATGPWVDELREQTGADQSGKRLFLTRGIHLVFPREKIPIRQAMYFDAGPDGRMIFAIPRGSVVYIGTTDTPFSGKKGQPGIDLDDVQYLLAAANRMLPGLLLTAADIESCWSGVRPLIYEEGKSPSDISRRDEIFVSPSGLISIAGGKLTGYRKMAQRAVDRVADTLPRQNGTKWNKPATEDLVLSGAAFASEQALASYAVACREKYPFPPERTDELVHRYGRNATRILDRAAVAGAGVEALQEAEWQYAIEQEMCRYPADFLIRRSGMLYFDRPRVWQVYERLFPFMKKTLHWSDEQSEAARRQFEAAYDASLPVKITQ